jgi:hypothetical protein
MLNSTFDVLHRRGLLDDILLQNFLRAPDEEDDAQDRSRGKQDGTVAIVCIEGRIANDHARTQ